MTAPHNEVDLGKVRTPAEPEAKAWLNKLLNETTATTTQDDAGRDEWILDFDYPTTPISPNGAHGNPYAHAKKVKAVRAHARRLAQHQGIPALGRIRTQLTWYVLTNRRRDPLNLTLTLKAMVDGLVDAGLTTDDTGTLIHTPVPRIMQVDRMTNRAPWMELTITRWAGHPTTDSDHLVVAE